MNVSRSLWLIAAAFLGAFPAPAWSEGLPAGPATEFRALEPPVLPELPQVQDSEWVRSPIDHFVLARLEAAGLRPAPPADRRTLIRRATFDLTGLPPTPEELQAFLVDGSPDAFARVLERLLASPHYGERWGRHWLDVARYADSNGLDENLAYANAWRYRDYVIAAFNADTPYDRFIHEQLAGDLLPPDADADGDEGRADRVVATGFLSLGAKMLAEDDPVKMQMDIIDEQVDTVGRVFLGLTFGCARCHDHKYDPISIEDYYGLAGIFKSTKTMENFKVVARWQERPLATPEALRAREEHRARIEQASGEIAAAVDAANAALEEELRRHVADHLLAARDLARLEAFATQAAPFGASDLGALEGAILLEAEDFTRGNVQKDFSTYGDGIGVLVNRGELPNFVEYDVQLPRAGAYQFELRYAAESARPCRLSINGRVMKTDAAGGTTGSWYPDTQTWTVEGVYRLPKGESTIRLEHPQFFPHIDKLLLVPVTVAGEDHDPPDGAATAVVGSTAGPAFEAHPELARRWAGYLAETEGDADSVFSVWHAFVEGEALPADVEHPIARALLADPRPQTLRNLAVRYEELFRGSDVPPESLAPVHAAFRSVLDDPDGPFALPAAPESFYPAETAAALARRREQLQALEAALPQLPEAMAVSEAEPEDLRVHLRGEHLSLGEEVRRRFPRALASDDAPPIDKTQSGRLPLARWITHPENPLAARVMVNRIWQGHFGEALVRTPDNFGQLGEPPAHPELLDWLAVRFVESGWSVKALHREIMRSSTYRMSAAWDKRAFAVDPDNRLWWRMNRRRLEAEAVRDAILAVAGTLDLEMGGSLLPIGNREYVTSTANVNPEIYESRRRSVYLPVVRSALYDMFQAFDFPDPSTLAARRASTTVAPQALFMMNSQVVSEQTRAMAEGLLAKDDLDDAGRVRDAWLRAYSRPPSPDETARALAYVERYAFAQEERGTPAEESRRLAWQSLCRAVLGANEFVYLE